MAPTADEPSELRRSGPGVDVLTATHATAGTGGVEESQEAIWESLCERLPGLADGNEKDMSEPQAALNMKEAVMEIGQLYTLLARQVRMLTERFDHYESKTDKALTEAIDMIGESKKQEDDLWVQVAKLTEVFKSRNADIFFEMLSTSKSMPPPRVGRIGGGCGSLGDLASGTVTSAPSINSPASAVGSSRLASTPTFPQVSHEPSESGAPSCGMSMASPFNSPPDPPRTDVGTTDNGHSTMKVLNWQEFTSFAEREHHQNERAIDLASSPTSHPVSSPLAVRSPPSSQNASVVLPPNLNSRPTTPTSRSFDSRPLQRASGPENDQPLHTQQGGLQQKPPHSQQHRIPPAPKIQQHPPVVHHTHSSSCLSRHTHPQHPHLQATSSMGMESVAAAIRSSVPPRSVVPCIADGGCNFGPPGRSSWHLRGGGPGSANLGGGSGSINVEVSSQSSRTGSPCLASGRALTPARQGYPPQLAEQHVHLSREVSDPSIQGPTIVRVPSYVGALQSPVVQGRHDRATVDGVPVVGSPPASGQLLHTSPSPPRMSPMTPRHGIPAAALRRPAVLPQPECVAGLHPRC